MTSVGIAEEFAQVRRMRMASVVEGITLVTLLFIAVPLKHLLGFSVAVAIMGPVHGVAFVYYAWTLIQTVSGGDFRGPEIAGMIVAAFIPFGGFFNDRVLARRQAALQSSN
jgi:integral membrane protein